MSDSPDARQKVLEEIRRSHDRLRAELMTAAERVQERVGAAQEQMLDATRDANIQFRREIRNAVSSCEMHVQKLIEDFELTAEDKPKVRRIVDLSELRAIEYQNPIPPLARQLSLPVVSGPVAKVIVEALAEAGSRGMTGAELNEVVKRAGFQKDASEKSKGRLKREGKVRHDEKARMWFAIDQINEQSS